MFLRNAGAEGGGGGGWGACCDMTLEGPLQGMRRECLFKQRVVRIDYIFTVYYASRPETTSRLEWFKPGQQEVRHNAPDDRRQCEHRNGDGK